MRRQFVAQVLRLAHTGGGLAQVADLAQQAVDLLLLAQDDFIQLINQVFGEAGLDLQIGQPLFNIEAMGHVSARKGCGGDQGLLLES